MAKSQKTVVNQTAITETQLPEQVKIDEIQEVITPQSWEIKDEKNVLFSKGYYKNNVEYATPFKMLKGTIDLLKSILVNTDAEIYITGDYEQTNVNEDKIKNVSYGRISLTAKFKFDDEMTYHIGLLIALDGSAPKIKLYRGPVVTACTNLCIWGAENITEFKWSEGIKNDVVLNYFETVAEQIQRSRIIIDTMKSITMNYQDSYNCIGSLIFKTQEAGAKVKNGNTTILNAVKLMSDSKSIYFAGQDNFNAWKFYNACTEFYASSYTIFDIPEKTRDLYTLLTDGSESFKIPN